MPQLALHQRALAVGRIVLTTADTKVSTQSLSAFIDGQALARPSERVSAVSDMSRIEARSNSSHQSPSIESANKQDIGAQVEEFNPGRGLEAEASSINQSFSIENVNKQDIGAQVEEFNPVRGSGAKASSINQSFSIKNVNKQDSGIRVEKSNLGKGSDAQAFGYGSRYSEPQASDAREYLDCLLYTSDAADE